MKKIILSALFLLIFLNSFSQQNLIIEYDINFNFNLPMTKLGTLKINNNKSLFEVKTKAIKSKLKLNKDGSYSKIISHTEGDYADYYFLDFGKQQYILKEYILGKAYIVKRGLHKIGWKITDKTKNIGSFDCQLAIGKFRGRTYNAWFTTKIPIKSGPWKLYGLPGLIIEATDSLRQVQFLMKSIKTVNNLKISEPTKADKEITFEEYVSKKKNLTKELVKKINSKLPREISGSSSISKSKGLEDFNEVSN